MSLPLQRHAIVDNVNNVCIFIADSLREDHVPDWIAERGTSASAVAPATYTGASVPSLLTGLYPSQHRCWEFDDTLATTPMLLDRHHSYRADTIWTHLDDGDKPPIRQTRASAGPELGELSTPFVYIEHDKGGHSPYGYSFAEYSTPEFFANIDSDDIPGLYQNSIRTSASRFRNMLTTLEERELLEDTLVVFTSDHGELLGESKYGGLYGHGRPMVPENVRVPMVFMGAGLPEGACITELLSGVDIAPTALGALDASLSDMNGINVWTNQPTNRTVRSEFWLQKSVKGRTFDVYNACGAWDYDGGIVRHRGPQSTRVTYAAWAHLHSEPQSGIIRDQMTMARFRNLLKVYAPELREYGNGLNEGDSSVTFTEFERGEPSADYYSDEQLRALGYVE